MPTDLALRVAAGFDWGAGGTARLWAVAELGDPPARQPEWREGGEAQFTVTSASGDVVASSKGSLSSTSRGVGWRAEGQPLEAGE